MPFCALLDPSGARLEELRRMALGLSGADPVYWTEGPVGLVHRRERAEERCAQPFLGDGRLCCALFEGRLERQQELAAELADSGCLRSERPGPLEILIAAFERWVEEFPRHLEGEWRALLWQRKNERLLGASGDGEPLHLARAGGRVVAATHAQVLVAFSDEAQPQTLAAGSLLLASRGGTEVRPA